MFYIVILYNIVSEHGYNKRNVKVQIETIRKVIALGDVDVGHCVSSEWTFGATGRQ